MHADRLTIVCTQSHCRGLHLSFLLLSSSLALALYEDWKDFGVFYFLPFFHCCKIMHGGINRFSPRQMLSNKYSDNRRKADIQHCNKNV